MTEHLDPRFCTEIMQDRLYFCTLSRLPTETSGAHFFSVDDTLLHYPFFPGHDFGPLNINCAYKFCQILSAKLSAPEHANKRIYYYCSQRPQAKSNAAVLIGIWLIVYGGRTSAQAYEPLKALEPYMPFRDASQSLCTFRLMVPHCLRAVAKALKLGWLDFDNWNSAQYEYFEAVENGDLNVIVPGKFIAFSGPHSTHISPEGYPTLTPADYLPIFKMFDVSTVIRLNKKCYDRKDFLAGGLQHFDLYHVDGSTPSNAIAEKFVQICEQVPGTIAVHCKAGLGRTGTTMGLYVMKHYRLTAAETIAWFRLCRPGMVIGPQQHYLKLQEARMWKLGKMLHGDANAASASSSSSTSSAASSKPPSRSGASSSSTSANHPSPTPTYAASQPNSPLSGTPKGSSYSANFDTPPSLHQQRIGSSTRSRLAQHSGAASSPSSSLTRTGVLARGRTKSRSGLNSSSALLAEDAKGVSAPLSAPQPLRGASTGKVARGRTPSRTVRNLFDSKPVVSNGGVSTPKAVQRRSPSTNGVRPTRGSPVAATRLSNSSLSASSPSPLSPHSPLSTTLAAASLYSPGSIGSKAKIRSASQSPPIGFRQTKGRSKV